MRNPDGTLVERSVRQLSGGERRRLALALALGFARLTANRGNLRCNVIVLDEVLRIPLTPGDLNTIRRHDRSCFGYN